MTDIDKEVSELIIVLIDDNQALLESMAALITVLGHRVLRAETGENGARIVHECRPDLVMCDISLAGELNGYGVARSLRLNRNFDAYLVAFSGFNSLVDCERALAAGFDRFITKPANMSTFVELFEFVKKQKIARNPAA